MRSFFLGLLTAVTLATTGFAQRATEADAASLRILDRTTGTLQDVVVGRGQTVKMGTISVRLTACRYPRGAISSDAFAFLTVDDTKLEKQIFNGWMVASSPALNPLEHARYDVWVLRCKTS